MAEALESPRARRIEGIDADALAAALPPTADAAFVHLDPFAGNMLASGSHVTAVLDFGPSCLRGDPRLDPIAAAVYLSVPTITPSAAARDVEVAMGWLRAEGLLDHLEPVRRWLAAYWFHATGDAKLIAWCHSVLLPVGG